MTGRSSSGRRNLEFGTKNTLTESPTTERSRRKLEQAPKYSRDPLVYWTDETRSSTDSGVSKGLDAIEYVR
jgi:hypothetical protein